MAGDREDFLRRWSRRKLGAAAEAAAPKPPAPAPAAPEAPLPPVDSLTPESDFSAFMRAKVDEGVKRAALKKLFADPRFNVIDGLDVDIDDYSKLETLSPDLRDKLEHVKSTLFGRDRERTAAAAPPADARGAAEEGRRWRCRIRRSASAAATAPWRSTRRRSPPR
jgi:hypothetical protein